MSSPVRPGDLVRFNFWTSYLAPGASEDTLGHVTWHELFPGDSGLVVHVESQVSASNGQDDTVIVMFSRTNHLLRVRLNQLERADDVT